MADPQQNINEFDKHSIQEIIGRYLPYWPLFILLIIIGSVIAFFKLRYATPIYQAYSSIVVKDDQTGGEQIISQLTSTGTRRNMQNEIALLKGRPLAMDIVRNLDLYAPVTEEGDLRNIAAYTSSPVSFRLQNPDSLNPVDKVYFTFNQANKTVTFNNQTYPLNQYVSTPYGTLMINPNKSYLPEKKTNRMFFSLIAIPNIAGGLQNNLAVSADKESTVINLAYTDESAKRAVDILNNLVLVYNRATIEDKNKSSANTLRFVEERLRLVEDDLDTVESRLQQFKSVNKALDIDAQGTQYMKSMYAYDDRVADINIQLSVLDQVQQYVMSKNPANKDAIVPSILGVSDVQLSNLLQGLYDAEVQEARLKKTMGDSFPSVVAVTQQINRMKPLILENIRTIRQNLLTSRKDLASSSDLYGSMLSSLPEKQRKLISIEREQKIKNSIYTFLLQKREEAAIAVSSATPDSRLVNDAQYSGFPVSPNRRNVYLQWVVSAIVLALIIIFIRENLNRNILSRAEIEKITATPIIAEIAYNKAKTSLVVSAGSRSLVAEQFRYLRTSLTYIGVNATRKKILLTSSISTEGKSFISVNLGATLALAGKKVVILEMDLRKPKLSDMLAIDRNIGLSDYFVGNKTADQIIKPTQIANLNLISCGAIPPNPAELLMNGKLQELLTYLEGIYDYVLVDTAPVGPVTDAYIISPLCDATLYVIRQSVTPRAMVEKLNDLLRNRRLKNMSILFNGVKRKRFGGYYGYGYSYGYGYLEEKKSKKRSVS